MDDTSAVLARLDRIEFLARSDAPPAILLEEIERLVEEADAWALAEGGEAARDAVARLRDAVTRDMIAA